MVWVWMAVPLIAAIALLVSDLYGDLGRLRGSERSPWDDHAADHEPRHATYASMALAGALEESVERCQGRPRDPTRLRPGLPVDHGSGARRGSARRDAST